MFQSNRAIHLAVVSLLDQVDRDVWREYDKLLPYAD